MLHHVLPGASERRHHRSVDVQTIECLVASLDSTSCFVDVGAHTGAILSDVVDRVPGVRCVAIEPLPELAAGLRTRFPGVEVVESVLGSTAFVAETGGRSVINRNVDDPGYSSVSRRSHPRLANPRVEPVEVAVTTLDAVVQAHGDVTAVKLDVEGFELEVLRGAERMLERERPLIVFEHEPVDDEGSTGELFQLFDDHEYSVSPLASWQQSGESTAQEFLEAVSAGVSYFVARSR